MTSWASYDPIAESWVRVAERTWFARPARDLVSLLALRTGERLLDVGAGTGALALEASRLVGAEGLVIALDPSIAMLRSCRRKHNTRLVAGALPSLPFPPRSFDALACAFVITHVSDADSAVRAMADTLKPAGRLGLSTWAKSPSAAPPGELWQSVVDQFIPRAALQEALDRALPAEARFASLEATAEALRGAGLRDVRWEERAYEVDVDLAVWIESRLLSLGSRFMQAHLPSNAWDRFKQQASYEVEQRFGRQLRFSIRVNFAIGVA